VEPSEAPRLLGNVGATGGPHGSSRRDKRLQGQAAVREILGLNIYLRKKMFKLTLPLQVLGLSQTASQNEVTARWRTLSRDNHPVGGGKAQGSGKIHGDPAGVRDLVSSEESPEPTESPFRRMSRTLF